MKLVEEELDPEKLGQRSDLITHYHLTDIWSWPIEVLGFVLVTFKSQDSLMWVCKSMISWCGIGQSDMYATPKLQTTVLSKSKQNPNNKAKLMN
jgi:hypothetical protein